MNEGEIVSSELFVYILCTIFAQQSIIKFFFFVWKGDFIKQPTQTNKQTKAQVHL